MDKLKELIVKRLPKFFAGNLFGTAIDTLVLWLFSHLVFHDYVGQVIVSPIISFECAVMANFVFSYYVTWKDRISQL
jgi:putative flippase GtrA